MGSSQVVTGRSLVYSSVGDAEAVVAAVRDGGPGCVAGGVAAWLGGELSGTDAVVVNYPSRADGSVVVSGSVVVDRGGAGPVTVVVSALWLRTGRVVSVLVGVSSGGAPDVAGFSAAKERVIGRGGEVGR